LDATSRYHRLLEADPAAASEQAEALRAAFLREGVTFGGEPMATLLRPCFLAEAEWHTLRASASRVMQVAGRVARQAFDGDVRKLCALLGTSDAEEAWIEPDPGPPDLLLSRLDALLTPAGPRFIEINSDAPAGFGYGDRMARLFRELPVMRAFEREVPLQYQGSEEALVRGIAAHWRATGGTGRPRIAIADWAEAETRADEEILREAFAVRGFECVLADPRAMEIHRGRLHAGGAPVDLVYRRAVLSELVGREIEVQAFMGAYRHRLCPFVNSFRSRITEDKAFLAVLSDEAFAHLLTAEERELLGRVLPWTRRLEERRTRKAGADVDLVPYVLANRESLVLKPAHEYGGREVIVGSEASWPEWDAAVRGAIGGPWVVQERVTPPEELFPVFEAGELRIVPLKVNHGPFSVAGAPAGAVARASSKPVVNVSVGGAGVPTFVVD
jgi:hypothetical protein